MQCDSFEYGLVSHASTSWHSRDEMFIIHLGPGVLTMSSIVQNTALYTAVYGCHH